MAPRSVAYGGFRRARAKGTPIQCGKAINTELPRFAFPPRGRASLSSFDTRRDRCRARRCAFSWRREAGGWRGVGGRRRRRRRRCWWWRWLLRQIASWSVSRFTGCIGTDRGLGFTTGGMVIQREETNRRALCCCFLRSLEASPGGTRESKGRRKDGEKDVLNRVDALFWASLRTSFGLLFAVGASVRKSEDDPDSTMSKTGT